MPQLAAILVKVCRLFDECEPDEQQRMVRWLVSQYGIGDPVIEMGESAEDRQRRLHRERQAAYVARQRDGLADGTSVSGASANDVSDASANDVSAASAPHNVVPVVALNGPNNRQVNEEAKEVLQFLNSQTGRSYRTVEANLSLIRNRIKDGATLANCKGVIARKSREWRGTEMEKYLRPATLFNRIKFEQYLGERSAE